MPFYNEVEISVCNICGTEISSNEVAHAKQHVLTDEGRSHHNDYRSAVVEYETRHHVATVHYEAVKNGGHCEPI